MHLLNKSLESTGNRDNKLTFYDVRKEEEICEAQFEMDVHEF